MRRRTSSQRPLSPDWPCECRSPPDTFYRAAHHGNEIHQGKAPQPTMARPGHKIEASRVGGECCGAAMRERQQTGIFRDFDLLSLRIIHEATGCSIFAETGLSTVPFQRASNPETATSCDARSAPIKNSQHPRHTQYTVCHESVNTIHCALGGSTPLVVVAQFFQKKVWKGLPGRSANSARSDAWRGWAKCS